VEVYVNLAIGRAVL